ncbi:uncharacterized protein [Diadema setosum]|uniref:uncharacterized protein n=1 Tax=Diadema setosum TaxID=31175 RepID=UPI003B3B8F17
MFHTCGNVSPPGSVREDKVTGDVKSPSKRCAECQKVSAKIMAEKEVQETIGVLRDRLRIMQIMVDDCAAMFEQKKIKKWKAARRKSGETDYQLKWTVVASIVVMSMCYLLRLLRSIQPEPCLPKEDIDVVQT